MSNQVLLPKYGSNVPSNPVDELHAAGFIPLTRPSRVVEQRLVVAGHSASCENVALHQVSKEEGMSIGFSRDIRPYFTACFRSHMISFGGFDLWSETDVKQQHAGIKARVAAGDMPPGDPADSPCPEGGWDQITRDQFLSD